MTLDAIEWARLFVDCVAKHHGTMTSSLPVVNTTSYIKKNAELMVLMLSLKKKVRKMGGFLPTNIEGDQKKLLGANSENYVYKTDAKNGAQKKFN